MIAVGVLGVLYLVGKLVGPPETARDTAIAAVSIRDVSWSKDYSLMRISATIVNENPFPIKDVEITCRHSARSGTQIDSNTRTVYEVVPANGTDRISSFDMGFIHDQTVSTDCRPSRVSRVPSGIQVKPGG